MNFQTEIKQLSYPFTLKHEDKIISFGSCFSENVGQKLEENKFDVCINPFGILFNPISVSKAIEDCLLNKGYTEEDLDSNGEIHFSFNHHSKYSGLEKDEVLECINKGIKEANSYFYKSKVLIITLGSAWIYRNKETGEVVANCYKLPQNQFNKELLSVNEITETLNTSISKIKAINQSVNIITTISPVRHWKDGVVENQQSKATLHLALKEINESNENCHYFPSYEIMMDELRDYRFYAKDMLHPSELAINYIWEKFSNSFFSRDTQELNLKIIQIKQGIIHRPFNSISEKHKKFKENLLSKIHKIEEEYPYLNFSTERGTFIG